MSRKAEQKAARKRIAEMTKTEGWVDFKKLLPEYVNSIYQEIMLADKADPNLMAALSYKLKYSVQVMTVLFDECEKMREDLDN